MLSQLNRDILFLLSILIMQIGLIGTGIMGSAIARRLLAKGYELIVYNRTREKAERLKIFNVRVADTPKQIAEESQLILTVLKDADAVRSVCFDEDGIIHAKKAVTLADVSTISPIHSREIADKLYKHNIIMIDTPVMGGPPLAENGELIVMAAGNKDILVKYEDVFKAISKKIFYLGKNGSGCGMKLAMNLQIAMLALALSEGMTLVNGLGLDPEKFLTILNSTYFKTGMSERKGPKMAKHNFEKTFALSMMLKDLYAINFTAKEHNLALPMSSMAEEVYRMATNLGYDDIDYTGILAFIEHINALNED
jgi:3-hydroxyisobutyrate dehydrogenase